MTSKYKVGDAHKEGVIVNVHPVKVKNYSGDNDNKNDMFFYIAVMRPDGSIHKFREDIIEEPTERDIHLASLHLGMLRAIREAETSRIKELYPHYRVNSLSVSYKAALMGVVSSVCM